MKVLKIKCFQESASYKKPFMLKTNETYPLPPYMTISGWLHSVLGVNSYVDLNISVQGNFEALYSNYQTIRFYKSKEVTTMPLNMHELLNVNLIIHISAAEEVLNDIYSKILNQFESLGRYEDLLRIDDVKFIELNEYNVDYLFNQEDNFDTKELSSYRLRNNIYTNKDLALENNLNSIVYKLNTHYVHNKSQSGRKIYTVNKSYVEAGSEITIGKIMLDEDGDIVSFYK